MRERPALPQNDDGATATFRRGASTPLCVLVTREAMVMRPAMGWAYRGRIGLLHGARDIPRAVDYCMARAVHALRGMHDSGIADQLGMPGRSIAQDRDRRAGKHMRRLPVVQGTSRNDVLTVWKSMPLSMTGDHMLLYG